MERTPLVADISRVKYTPADKRPYCNLPEKDAQCLAAMNAPNARLLEQEADAIGAQPTGHHHRDSNATTQEVLRLQAAHERNRNASAALQLLFRIAGYEAAADNLRQQLNEVEGTLVDLAVTSQGDQSIRDNYQMLSQVVVDNREDRLVQSNVIRALAIVSERKRLPSYTRCRITSRWGAGSSCSKARMRWTSSRNSPSRP